MKLKCGTDKLKHRIFFASKMAVPEVVDTFILCGKKSELSFLLLNLPRKMLTNSSSVPQPSYIPSPSLLLL